MPFKHLIVVLQIARFDRARTEEILSRNGYANLDSQALGARIDYATRWLARFAPEEIKFSVSEELPAAAASLDLPQKEFLRRLAPRLTPGMRGEEIHALIYELAKEREGVPPAHLFEAIYLALAGKTQGPRAGAFLAFVGSEFAARRLMEAAG